MTAKHRQRQEIILRIPESELKQLDVLTKRMRHSTKGEYVSRNAVVMRILRSTLKKATKDMRRQLRELQIA